ncbi:MAG TPA: glycosyltransferase family 2 protein [Sphingomonas sp.]|nr:glycosyltransferase family 2 protein [Sphingomonas sp.]
MKTDPLIDVLRPKPRVWRSPRWFLRNQVKRIGRTLREAVLPLRVRHVSGPENVSAASDEMIVACLIRDGLAYLDEFLRHYRALGARHIVFIDNGSSDGTLERLAGEPGVTLLRSAAPYKTNNVLLKRYLLRRFGQANWVLLVDADELFDYTDRDRLPLRALLADLNAHGFTAVVAQLLDLFPSTALQAECGADWRRAHRFYDISAVVAQDYSGFFGSLNAISEPRIKNLWGGVRTRFGVRNHLTKHPLLFPGRGLRYLSSHNVAGARLADFSAVLLHYKYVGRFLPYMQRIAGEGSFFAGSAEYRSYVDAFASNPDLGLFSPQSRELRDVDQLVREGFLVAADRAAPSSCSGKPTELSVSNGRG